MARHYALGIDIGTTAVKVLLISGNGQLVCEITKPHDLVSFHPGWSEEKPKIWWANVASALQELAAFHREKIPDISGIGVSGMVPALVFLNREGKVLRNSIQQNDARCTKELEDIQNLLDQENVFERTGGYTNQQHLLPRLLWVLRNEPEIMENTSYILGSYDYITYCLTGVLQVEKNFAVESGLYDIRTNQWIPEWMDLLGLRTDLLLPVNDSTSVIGETCGIEAVTGLPDGIPVIAGSADHVASALAAGMTKEGKLLIKFGGAGDILYCIDRIAPQKNLFWDEHIIPGKYLLNGCTATSGSLLKWTVRELFQDFGENAFAKYDRLSKDIPAGSNGLVVLPYFLGEKTPLFDPEARGTIVGLNLSHTREDIYHAVLESVIYSFRHHAEILEKAGYHPSSIAATDGGARSPLWCQIASNILQQPVCAYTSHPGSALGVAFAAGMGTGLFHSWEEIQPFLGRCHDYFPERKTKNVYDECYAVYRTLYCSLKDNDVFHRISKL